MMELYHHGVKGMKWGVRRAKKQTAPNHVTKQTNTKKPTKRDKDKEDIDRMIKGLEQHERAMKASLLSSAAGISLRNRGQNRLASLLGEFGNMQASRLSISGGYNFWK